MTTAMAPSESPTAAPAAPPVPARPGRSSFLDAIRSIALLRVITWHALGAPWISWVVATMPTMFFVAGHLLAQSLERRPARVVLRDRLRRLLVPFWVFGALVWIVLALVHLRSPSALTAPDPARLLAWIVPLVDPVGSPWEGGWISAPLWYLRAYVWLLLLSPLLLMATRRWGTSALLAPLVGTLALDVIFGSAMATVLPAEARWTVADFVLYSGFWMLGFLSADGLLERRDRRELAEWALLGAVVALVWWSWRPVDTGVVNHSAPSLMAWGVLWLGLFLAARPLIERAAGWPVVRPALYWLNRRAVSVYLWHSPAIVGGYWILERVGIAAPSPLVLVPTTLLTVAAAVATGWAEDLAARRPVEWWPRPGATSRQRGPSQLMRPLPMAAGASLVVGLVLAASLVPVTATEGTSGSGLALPPAPSGRPETVEFDAVPDAEDAPGPGVTVPRGGSVEERLLAVADAWRAEHEVAGVRLGVELSDGTRYVLASGREAGGAPLDLDAPAAITSITKTMTAAIVLAQVEVGRLTLDDPVAAPAVLDDTGLPGSITVRQLLQHTAGLAPYQETAAYDPSQALTTEQALRAAAQTPLQWEPGTAAGYSNSGYLLLGELAAAVTGRPYEALFEEIVLDGAGLEQTSLDDTPTAGWVGGAAGGAVSTVPDLLSWGAALYRDGRIIGPDLVAEMTSIDNQFRSGLGANPICPCSRDAEGVPTVTSIGHDGGSGTLQFSPSDRTLVAVLLTESMWTDRLRPTDVHELLAGLGAAVGPGDVP